MGDVFDAAALTEAVVAFGPDLVMHQLTDLPDDPSLIATQPGRNARIRREGTANLVAAAQAAGATRFVAQSVAWTVAGEDGAAAVAELERLVLEVDGVVLRYGQFYGPGTYHQGGPPPPRVHIDTAARLTLPTLSLSATVVTIVDR